MIVKRIIICLLFSFFISSCHSDDNETAQNELFSSWTLKNVSGGLLGLNIDYTQEEVTWTFTQDNLQVVNNIITAGPEDIYAGHETGTYNYSIELDSNDQEVLFIEGVERGVLNIDNNTLYIDDGIAADGFMSTFEK